MKLDPKLVQDYASALHEIRLDGARAAELAEEIESLRKALAEISSRVEFEDEPADFLRTLWALRES